MKPLADTIMFVLSLPFWMVVGKVVLALMLWIFIGLSLYVIVKSKHWHDRLVALEYQANIARDDAMFDFMRARQAIDAARTRLAQRQRSASAEATEQVVKNFGSLVWLIIRKEQSLLQWGLLGAKLARSAYQFLSKGE